jgi:hypothetical protein
VTGSEITDAKFLIQILNSLTSDYELQVELIEKYIRNTENPISIEEVKEDLSLRFMSLTSSSKSELTRSVDLGEENAFFLSQFKEKSRNCGKLGHRVTQCKSIVVKEDIKDIICNSCKKPDLIKTNYFKL